MEGEIAQLVQEKISAHKIMMFTKSYCQYCKSAKETFNKIGAEFEVMELDKHPKGDEIEDILNMTEIKSFPRIFIKGNCYHDLLKKMVEKVEDGTSEEPDNVQSIIQLALKEYYDLKGEK